VRYYMYHVDGFDLLDSSLDFEDSDLARRWNNVGRSYLELIRRLEQILHISANDSHVPSLYSEL
jgi:hypothetical protein